MPATAAAAAATAAGGECRGGPTHLSRHRLLDAFPLVDEACSKLEVGWQEHLHHSSEAGAESGLSERGPVLSGGDATRVQADKLCRRPDGSTIFSTPFHAGPAVKRSQRGKEQQGSPAGAGSMCARCLSCTSHLKHPPCHRARSCSPASAVSMCARCFLLRPSSARRPSGLSTSMMTTACWSGREGGKAIAARQLAGQVRGWDAAGAPRNRRAAPPARSRLHTSDYVISPQQQGHLTRVGAGVVLVRRVRRALPPRATVGRHGGRAAASAEGMGLV